jgi:hypothetical protein
MGGLVPAIHVLLYWRCTQARWTMPRHASYIPHGVIPAVLLPFENDLSID